MPAGFELIMLAMYGSMGLISLVIGVLGIWAGIRMLKFRGRTLGIVALSSGLLSIAGCYCLPTAIGLFIYGLIVLLNEPVKRAFAMGEQGRTASEIQNQFARLPGSWFGKGVRASPYAKSLASPSRFHRRIAESCDHWKTSRWTQCSGYSSDSILIDPCTLH